MKNNSNIFYYLFFWILIFIVSCNYNKPPDINNINGTWKIYLENEYSQIAKNMIIKIEDSTIIYDNIELNYLKIINNHLTASKHFTDNSIFYIVLNLTYKEKNIWGYEYHKTIDEVDSTYIFGEKISDDFLP